MNTGMLGLVHSGLKIVTSPHLPRFKLVQFRFPKSKRKRIRMKWAKRPENFKQVPSHTMYRMGDTVVVHPDDLSKIKAEVARQQSERMNKIVEMSCGVPLRQPSNILAIDPTC